MHVSGHPKPKGAKNHRFRLSHRDRKVLAEIRFHQKSDKTALEGTFKNTSFKKLVRAVGDEFKWGLRWSELSLIALAEASQAFMDKLFADADLCRNHKGRKTLMSADLQLARRFQVPSV